MKEGTPKRVEVTANLAIIVTAILLCAVLAKFLISKGPAANSEVATTNQLSSSANRRANTQIPPGTKVSIDGVDWAKNGQTLVLVLSDQCHFCGESAPFYQRLVREHGKTRLVAVVPQTVDRGRRYLNKLDVTVDDVKQASFGSLGVRGTPTLILVDNNGSAIKSWIGKLAPNVEAAVIDTLQ